MRTRTRVITAGVAMAALGGSFATGYALAGQAPAGTDRGRPVLPAPELRLANADLSAATSCDELLSWYVDRGVRRVTPYGWEDRTYWPVRDFWGAEQPMSGEALSSAPVPTTSRATSSGTGTNTQEAGVDEPDIVKTDGRLLVRADDDRVTTYDVTGAHPEQLESIELPGMQGAEILLAGATVVAVGRDDAAPPGYADPIPRQDTRVVVLDVSDPGAPVITDSFLTNTGLVATRQTGDTVRLVLSARLPDLDFVEPGRWRSEDRALEQNRDRIRESSIEDWMPTVTTYGDDAEGTTRPLVDCDQVALPGTEAGLGTMIVAGFDAAEPTDWDVGAVATASDVVYMSTDRLYLATGSWWPMWPTWPVLEEPGVVVEGGLTTDPEAGTTQLYSFALEGTGTRYVASGEVDGRIADRWSMDESGGVLRVAVGPTSQTGNFSSILTLVEDGDDLVQVGHLDKLGVNEEIKSVRWFDGLAIVVTFRQTDPLYAVDLSTPARPRLIGALKIPGFSEYLHPLGQRRLLGLGMAADRTGTTHGAQAALFTVRDLARVTRMDVVRFGKDTAPQAAYDPRQFTWLPDQRTALAVISDGWTGRTGSVAVLHVEDGRLRTSVREVEYGSEVDQVRLVPLPTGRVVLVTGDDVRFFDPAP